MSGQSCSNEGEIRVRRRPDRHCFAHAQGGLCPAGIPSEIYLLKFNAH
jgi:hypothetical protein